MIPAPLDPLSSWNAWPMTSVMQATASRVLWPRMLILPEPRKHFPPGGSDASPLNCSMENEEKRGWKVRVTRKSALLASAVKVEQRRSWTKEALDLLGPSRRIGAEAMLRECEG